jgi:dTDP-4-amino-4,6-dideoxygalactose transaminase
MIAMNDFRAEPPELREAVIRSARRVLESGWYVLGNEVTALEKLWAAACGLSHGIGVGNGTDAIEIVLRALEIGPGHEVITTPMTAFATVLAIFRAGATPVLADIDPQTALLSIESARRCASSKTKAVVLVHLYGQVRAMDAWMAFAAEHGIALVEDCAQAHLAAWHGKVAGSFGRAGTYSFYPTKNLGAPGDAGMIVTEDGVLARRAACLRNYGQSVRYQHSELGLNSRLDELQAAILAERFKWLTGFTQRRREIAGAYRRGIENPLVQILAEPDEPSAHVYHLFVVNCARREALQAHLQARQIQSLIHYPIAVHQQEPCRNIARDPLGLGQSERHAATCLSLPCHPQLTDSDVAEVISALNSFQVC